MSPRHAALGLVVWLTAAQPAASNEPAAGERLSVLAILDEALDAARAIEKPADRFNTIGRVATEMAKSGHVREALRAAEAIEPVRARESALVDIAKVQARAGDINEALETVARTSDMSAYRADAFLLIIELRAQGGDLDGARQLMGALPTGLRTLGYWAIARAQADSGDLSGAAQTLESQVGRPAGNQERMIIAEAQLKAGDEVGPLVIAEQFRKDAISHDVKKHPKNARDNSDYLSNYYANFSANYFRDLLLEGVAMAQAGRGRAKKAAETAGAIASPYQRARVTARIAATAARAGDRAAAHAIIQTALDQAGTIEREGRGIVLMDIATAQALAGETEVARANYLRSLGQLGAVNQHLVAQAQARAGDVEGAVQTSQAITCLPVRARALEAIADVRLGMGDVAGAMVTAQGISEGYIQRATLARIAETQAVVGDTKGARATLREIDQKSGTETSETLKLIAKVQGMVDSTAEARKWAIERATPGQRIDALLGLAKGLPFRKPDDR